MQSEKGCNLQKLLLSKLALMTVAVVMVARCSDANFQAGTGGPSQGKQKLNPKLPPITPGEKTLNLRYGNGIKPTVADYLFVLDNSVSMQAAAASVASGLAAISKDRFPESTQIAVMTTMVAKDAMAPNLTTHADIIRNGHSCIDLEPGFLSLYNGSAQEKFKACRNNDYPSAYPIKGCDQSWFKPFDVNSDGQRCFSAALQSPFHAVGCEAGLYALEQMLTRNQGKPIFRENTALNIIFISDERQGCTASETIGTPGSVEGTATAQRIKDAIFANSKIASLKISGVIPPNDKIPSNALGYKEVIDFFKGFSVSLTAATTNYNDIIESLVTSKADITQKEFAVPTTAQKITTLLVDGVVQREGKDYSYNAAAKKVSIPSLDPQKSVELTIKYLD